MTTRYTWWLDCQKNTLLIHYYRSITLLSHYKYNFKTMSANYRINTSILKN